ncbi:MAG: nickel pincer cofactor biosynthesis protein LarC [Cyanobacteria bacterium]|nr:nickel pincer cofactor biosynthesis protein LarC [Cyanobacteria bacterium CG_2015-22_32_23]NCQ04785.1 nickel pincer cofactor biosynthesis protein LarC [Cyanobacteria bacterium CG_2015-09_32_10]NCQ42690.1 nickel pincer cofactor biosynthesis protein LarC [Cyanobacteria bacterium CG_2015-04_32_10]NCS84958.1 nickel pincer cofactor biosynthesis protein LarC [Cyanobacteria bacterium CG_2015-02_32_10]
MERIAYLQCPTGIAGDMFLGALVSAGVPLEYIENGLKGLNLSSEYQLKEEKVLRQGQSAVKIHVDLIHHHHHHRHLADIENLIISANLSAIATTNSLAIFRQLAEAEGKVHGISPQKVHFHEVGAIDALVDIVGTCLGLDYLNIQKLYCSPLPTGGGTIKAAHGKLSVPVPAVLELLQTRQTPLYSNGIDKELVTPTGAAIATTLVTKFGQPPQMSLIKIGRGAGSQDLEIPNILQLWIGESKQSDNLEEIAVLETQIDDTNPQVFGYLLEELLKIGAKDVFTQPVGMKKNRQGILLTVICDVDKIDICETIIFRETTTIGIRRQIQQRSILAREIVTVKTKYGDIRVKVAKKDDEIVNIQPEYEDCAMIARKSNIPLNLIALEAQKNAQH